MDRVESTGTDVIHALSGAETGTSSASITTAVKSGDPTTSHIKTQGPTEVTTTTGGKEEEKAPHVHSDRGARAPEGTSAPITAQPGERQQARRETCASFHEVMK